MDSLTLLATTAVIIAFTHTILGPDHYLPFIVISKAKRWTLQKTLLVTFFCGLGHVLSSVVLGLIGIAVGISLSRIEFFESSRGNIAAWLLIAFGLVYTVISLRKLYKSREHDHTHTHADGTTHSHEHAHFNEHSHIHGGDVVKMTPWILFIIFVFGPCEPLIPILMYPAARHNIAGVILVAVLFSTVTILTMLAVVTVTVLGLNRINVKPLARYGHVTAGIMVFLSGFAIQFLGL